MLSIVGKLYICCLVAVVAYTTYSLSSLMVHISAHVNRLSDVKRRVDNVRQLLLLLILLFGVSFANEVLAALRSIHYSSMSLAGASIQVFGPCAAFAFIVFCVLTLLHIFQWIVSSRLRRVIPLS